MRLFQAPSSRSFKPSRDWYPLSATSSAGSSGVGAAPTAAGLASAASSVPGCTPRKPPDTAGEIGSGGQSGEARGAGGRARDRPEPVAQTGEVYRGRGRDVLQVGPGRAAVAAEAQPEGAHALRERALDAGPPGVAAPALLGREAPSRGPERLVLRPRLQLQVAGAVLGARAKGLCRAGAAVGLAEHHRDVGRAGVVDLRAPGRGQLALRAAGP